MATSDELFRAAQTVEACQDEMALTTQITAARSTAVVRGGTLEGQVDEYFALAEALHAAAAAGLGSAAALLRQAAAEAAAEEDDQRKRELGRY